MNLALQERQKYEAAWKRPDYRSACHSLDLWHQRRDLFPPGFRSVLDIGCGPGRLFALWNDAGFDAWAVDIAPNCLDADVAERWGEKLLVSPLWRMAWHQRLDFGICTDVMEHVPPEHVQESLRRIGLACREVLFKIAHVPDVCGGGSYHLTVRPPEWWIARMEALGGEVERLGHQERSGHQDSLIHWRPQL